MSAVRGTDGETHTAPNDGNQEEKDRQSGGGSGASRELSDSEIFDVLRNARRRSVISYLMQHDDQASVKKLTKYATAQEYDIDIEDVSSEQYKRVYTALCQCHLPRLEEYGVIDFEEDSKTVSLEDTARQIEPFLHKNTSLVAARLELGVAIIVATLVTLGILQVGPFGSISVVVWAMVAVAGLVGTAVVEYLT